MKPPDHPVPSGDREIARLTMRALEMAGFTVGLVSTLRTLDMHGDQVRQHALLSEADLEVERLLEAFRPDPPALWFTYHCYWKAPDLIGPRVAAQLGIPYVVSEASHAPRRLSGPWEWFAQESLRALRAADLVYWTTARDLPGLRTALADPVRAAQRLGHLPAFIDPGPRPMRHARGVGPLRLLTVAMMRAGDKMASFAALAEGLAAAEAVDWHLTIIGDGPMRAEIMALFARFAGQVQFTGRIDDADRLRAAYEAAELLVWPGVGEGIGMAYLEAQAAAVPCLAEDRPGPRDVILAAPPLPAPGDAAGFGAAIIRAAQDREALAAHGRAARLHVETRHSIAAAAARLRTDLGAVIGAQI